MYNIDAELEVIRKDYDLVGFKQDEGYMFYGNLKLNHTYDNITLCNNIYVSMFVPSSYPDKLPIVKDIGKKIDKDFHKNQDDILCLACDTEIYLDLKKNKNITISYFIERFLIPYLYSYTHYKKYGCVPFGEREHGVLGIIDFYRDYFKISDRKIALALLNYIVFEKYRGHNLCPCYSGKKLRNCHGFDIIQLKMLAGKDNIINDYNAYLTLVSRQKRSKQMAIYKRIKQDKKLQYYLFPCKRPFEIKIPRFYERYINLK